MSEVVNMRTGEIAAVSPQERSAVARLTVAIEALTDTVNMMPLAEVVDLRPQLMTIQVATRELDMSKDAQDLAAEAVRRCEWRMGRLIRDGQNDGTIRTRGQSVRSRSSHGDDLPSPYDFASHTQLTGNPTTGAPGILGFADAVTTPEQLDAALAGARSEGNMSRSNVVRHAQGKAKPSTLSRDQKADLIGDLAEQGHSSHQMADKVGVTPGRVREIARAFGIEIPADKVMGRGGNRIDHTAAVTSAVDRLDHLCSSLNFIDFTEVDGTEADEWVASLTASIAELRRFINKIKETTHV